MNIFNKRMICMLVISIFMTPMQADAVSWFGKKEQSKESSTEQSAQADVVQPNSNATSTSTQTEMVASNSTSTGSQAEIAEQNIKTFSKKEMDQINARFNLLRLQILESQITYHNKPYFRKLGDWFQSDRGIEIMVTTTITTCLFILITSVIKSYLSCSADKLQLEMEIYYPHQLSVTFDDVAGLTGAKADLQDIISYLENPDPYTVVGALIPKGVLMNGEPGNGKTLLARAVAGEACCPFISVSGSSFIQMYIGLGALRVRELFAKARQLAAEYGACIIFIDEIDALAKKRSNRNGGGSDNEHDQTVAQLLKCMDGLEQHENPIIVLAATNRADQLDEAVVRPGRFDRKVEVTKPFVKDRIALIEIALEKVVYDETIDVKRIARATGGFSGAELVNLINEAAIITGAAGRDCIELKDIELAFDHITLGREIQGMDQSDEAKWKTAVHEAGHAVGWLFGNNLKYAVHKASITPRSHTLGVVWATPLHESYESTEDEMKARIVVTLCGGLAEQLFEFGKSTGVSNDLAKARAIAYDMVVKYGMSEKLNYLSYDEIDYRLPNDIATEVHKEVQKIIDECFAVGKELIALHKNEIELIAKLLMEKGTVLGDEIYLLVGLPLPDVEFGLR